MPRYVMLLKYTDKGVANVDDSPKAGRPAFRDLAAKHGGDGSRRSSGRLGEYDGPWWS